VAAAGQTEDRLTCDRTPGEHDGGFDGEWAPLRGDVLEGGRTGPVEHHPEGAVVVVFEHQDHGPVEVRIDERWGRDEQSSPERSGRLVHAPIVGSRP